MGKGKLVRPINVLELLISENWTRTEVSLFEFCDFYVSDDNKLLIYDSLSDKYAIYNNAALHLNDFTRSIKLSAHPPLAQRQVDLKNINERGDALLRAFYTDHSLHTDAIPTPKDIECCIKAKGIDYFYETYILEIVLYIGNYLKATIYPNARWTTHSKGNSIADLYLLTTQEERVPITKKVNKYYFEKRSLPIRKIINKLSL